MSKKSRRIFSNKTKKGKRKLNLVSTNRKNLLDSRQDDQTNLSVDTTMLITGKTRKEIKSICQRWKREKKPNKQYRPHNITDL